MLIKEIRTYRTKKGREPFTEWLQSLKDRTNRIYFVDQDKRIIVLLCGGSKRSQKKDIALAETYWQDLKRRCYD